MTIGSGIAVAAVWIAVAVIACDPAVNGLGVTLALIFGTVTTCFVASH